MSVEKQNLSILFTTVETFTRQAMVNSAETPNKLLKTLDVTYERRGLVDYVVIQMKIGVMRYDIKTPFEEHLSEFQIYCSLMKSAGEKLPFNLKIARLLKTSPERWAQ